MTNRTRAVVLLALANALTGCDDARVVSPTAPTPVVAGSDAPSPTGSIQMKGTVSDTAFRELPGARVEVLSGPNAGMSTSTDARGEFTLTGRFDETTQFHATSAGHVGAVRTLQPFCMRCNPAWWINFALEPLDPPVNVAGTYALTIVADSTCTMLPPEMRSRTFTVTIPQASDSPVAGEYVPVQVAGATVLEGWEGISVGVAGNYIAFWLETLVEQLAPNTFLAFGGQAAARVDTSTMSTIVLPFAGSIEYCVTKSDPGRYEDCYMSQSGTHPRCESSNHRFILARR